MIRIDFSRYRAVLMVVISLSDYSTIEMMMQHDEHVRPNLAIVAMCNFIIRHPDPQFVALFLRHDHPSRQCDNFDFCASVGLFRVELVKKTMQEHEFLNPMKLFKSIFQEHVITLEGSEQTSSQMLKQSIYRNRVLCIMQYLLDRLCIDPLKLDRFLSNRVRFSCLQSPVQSREMGRVGVPSAGNGKFQSNSTFGWGR